MTRDPLYPIPGDFAGFPPTPPPDYPTELCALVLAVLIVLLCFIAKLTGG